MPMLSRQTLIEMSPELIQKLEAASRELELEHKDSHNLSIGLTASPNLATAFEHALEPPTVILPKDDRSSGDRSPMLQAMQRREVFRSTPRTSVSSEDIKPPRTPTDALRRKMASMRSVSAGSVDKDTENALHVKKTREGFGSTPRTSVSSEDFKPPRTPTEAFRRRIASMRSESAGSVDKDAESGLPFTDDDDGDVLSIVESNIAGSNLTLNLFDVSIDISEHGPSDVDSIGSDEDAEIRDSLSRPGESRRASKWSATVLFLASEVQVMVNLAELNPPEDFQMAPKKRCGDEDDGDESEPDEMPDKYESLDMQPLDSKDIRDVTSDPRASEQFKPIMKEYSNGGPIQPIVCNNGDMPPPYENLDKADNHSLTSKKSDKDDDDKDDDEDRRSETKSDSSSLDRLPHEDWGHKADFLLAVIGYAVDLSNVWRFPYLCYKNGGGAFIIPYFTTLIFGAMPIFFMEMALGQYHREGPIGVWKIVPMFKGIGYASCFMAYVVAFYYNVVIGWSFFYLFSSFTLDLPWRSCDHAYNSPECWRLEEGRYLVSSNVTSLNGTSSNVTIEQNSSVSSSYEFFERGMLRLHKSEGLEDLGGIQWQLLLCTLLTFLCLYFSLWKGVKSSGKVVYLTATMPYLILTILLIRGCLLPGAKEGIMYFITPKLDRLNDPNVWIDAAVQIMFSIGCGFGTHIAYASHNKFNNNCYADCLFTTAVNCFTSIFSGFVVFSYLGYMADRQQKDINDVAQEGPGLVFIVYPEAIATLPGSTAWAIVFFLMLITLGMDSAFGGLESPLTGLGDQFYRIFKRKYSREVLTALVVGTAFFFSIPCTTWGGMYVFKILDTFAAGTSIVFAVLIQVVAVSWLYGLEQFCEDIYRMTGYRPGIYWRICWKYLSPTFLLIIVISSVLHYEPLKYVGGDGTYVYPFYANVIGWFIACSVMAIIPLYVIYYLLTTKGTLRERISLGISPKWEHKAIKDKREVKRFQKQHWVYI